MQVRLSLWPSVQPIGEGFLWLHHPHFASDITAAAIVLGGGIGLFRYTRDKPYLSRADVTLDAELLVVGEHDVLKVTTCLISRSRGRLWFCGEERAPYVYVHAFTEAMLNDGVPTEWPEPLVAEPVFPGEEVVEAGETLQDVTLIPLGKRQPITLAYRVEALVNLANKHDGGRAWAWGMTTFVPVKLRPQDMPH
jgi:hypothetical protein